MYPSFVAVTSDKSAMPLVPLNDKDKKIKCDGNKVGFKQTLAYKYYTATIYNVKNQWKCTMENVEEEEAPVERGKPIKTKKLKVKKQKDGQTEGSKKSKACILLWSHLTDFIF